MELSQLENAILMTLEEAGEENIAALLNSVKSRSRRPSADEIDDYRVALADLVQNGFLEMAVHRDEASRRWMRLPKETALSLLRDLGSVVVWSNVQKLWTWSSPSPTIEILLTGNGAIAAREALSEHGWPGAN